MSINGSKYILLELDFFAAEEEIGELIYELELAGYSVIIAHAERYMYADYKYIEIGATTALQNGVGYGIITNNNELVLYIDKPVKFGDELKPIYLMFRGKK